VRGVGYVARVNETRNTYRTLVGKHKGKGPFGFPLNRYGDNIEMDLKEMKCEHADWVNLAEGRCKWRMRQWTLSRLVTV